METSRRLWAAVLLAGALCLLALPPTANARTRARAHARKTRVQRLCLSTRTHVGPHSRGARRRAARGVRSRACSGHRRRTASRTRHRRRHARTRPVTRADRQQPVPQAPPEGTGAGCQDTSLIPSEANLALVLEATLCLINRERAHAGERPLRSSSALADAAQAHSTSMAVHDYFDHVSPGGSTPLSRMRESGYLTSSTPGYEVGENIAWGSYTDGTPAAIVAAWMASPPHRANILDRSFRDTGLGVSPHLPSSFGGGAVGAIYTEDFGVIIGS